MTPGDDLSRRALPGWAPVLVLTALALWVRLAALPGIWGSDSLTYFDACRGAGAAATDRTNRWLVIGLVRGGLALGGWSPAAASVPGVLMSAAVVPVLWLALRRRLGDLLALLPCALWAFLGSDLEEVGEISADAMLALPCALAVWGLAAAARREEGRTAPLVAAGVALGVGAVLKETMLLALVGFAVGALSIGRGARRWRDAALLAVPAIALFAASLLVTPARLAIASQSIADAPAPVRAGSAEFLRRITVEIPELLLTASQSYGLLFVVALPLLVRLPLRALRGDPLAAAAVGGLLAFDLLPVSLQQWALLPAQHARYLLCLMPVLFAALADALRERPASTVERWASAAAAALAIAFVGRTPWTMVLVPPGVLLTVWPALPDAISRSVSDRLRLGLAGGVLIAATVAWSHAGTPPATADWIVAGAAAALVTTPWLVGRDRSGPAPYFAVGAGIVLAVVAARARFVPDAEWTAWSRLPATGRVYAERLIARRLSAASVAAGADASRIVLVETAADLPRELAPDDRVLARDAGPLGGGLRIADACRLPGSGLAEVPAGLGEAVLFAPAPR